MNLEKTIPILSAIMLVCSALLLQATPSYASDNVTVNVVVEQNVTVGQTAGPNLTPPPTPPSFPPAPPVPPVPPAPPTPHLPPMRPAPPHAPFYYPSYSWPYEYRWSTYMSPRVIVVQQPLPQIQVQTQPEIQPQLNVDPPPVINSFMADPVYVQPGQTVTLSWTVSDVLKRAIDVTISPDIGPVASSGSYNVKPDATTTYTLTATNIDGTVSANATVTVAAYAAASTYTTSPEITGSGSGLTGNQWPLYILLMALLAAAAVVVVILVTRKPRVTLAGARTGYQPAAAEGTRTGIPHTTPAQGAKFMTADGECVPIPGNAGALGRNDFLSLVKPSKADLISRQHLHVECNKDGYYIKDNNSTNGTRLNGSPITGKGMHMLKNNDMIDLGGALTLTFRT